MASTTAPPIVHRKAPVRAVASPEKCLDRAPSPEAHLLCLLSAPGQLVQKVRVPVQESKKVHNRRQRRRFSTLIPRERVVAATRQLGGHGLAEAELLADSTDLRPLCGARLQHEFVACRGVPFRASLVEFNLPARGTTPPRQALDLGGHTVVGNRKS